MSLLWIGPIVVLIGLAQLIPPPERRTCLIERSPSGFYATVTISTEKVDQGYLVSICDDQFRCSAELRSPTDQPLAMAWAITGELLVLADRPSRAGADAAEHQSNRPRVETFRTAAAFDQRRAGQPKRTLHVAACTAPSPIG